jgi:hypothetical protein
MMMNSMLAYPGRATLQVYQRLVQRNELAEGKIQGRDKLVDLADVRVPVMNVAGTGDVMVPVDVAHHVGELLPDSPEVRLETRPGWAPRCADRTLGPVAALVLATGVATSARADTPEEKFVTDLRNSNSVATTIPGTPDRWIAAGYTSCDRITRTSAQSLPIRAAINNEVIAATTFNFIPRQDAVALMTFAVLDLCPQLIPQRTAGSGS